MPGHLQTRILQKGELPILPGGARVPLAEHVCTTTLVWPENASPTPKNSLIVDPCFTPRGFERAQRRLAKLGLALGDIRYVFTTHPHRDHVTRMPMGVATPGWEPFEPGCCAELAGIDARSCPGHHPLLRALSFPATQGTVLIAGDAVLDRLWLSKWAYYWPNCYGRDAVVQTWRDVAVLLSEADAVIPGHGTMIRINPELLQALLGGWGCAAHSEDCPDVAEALRARLGTLREAAS